VDSDKIPVLAMKSKPRRRREFGSVREDEEIDWRLLGLESRW
jgi:hypothetical protein